MKKNKIIALITVLLLALAVYFYYQNSKGTIKPELKDFAIEDTSSVTKIFMVNKDNRQVLLEKQKPGVWMVNEKYRARPDAVNMLLKTMKRMDVKSPVSKASFDNVVSRLASKHVKVEVYTDDEKPEKVFYVGGATQDNYGTFMMLEGSSTPFIMHIPGFSGYLSTRFFVEEDDWRDKVLFRYSFNDIAKVEVENVNESEKSFIAENLGENMFQLTRSQSMQKVPQFDTVMLKQYLAQYRKLSFERFAPEVKGHIQDSLLQTSPVYKLSVEDRQGRTTTIEAYLKPLYVTEEDYVEGYEFDVERMYARINEDSSFVVIQYYTFDPLFLDVDIFIRE